MNKRDRTLIEDMLRNAGLARQFSENRSRDDIDSDLMFAYALVRAIEIVGEAANHISKEIYVEYPDVEWKNIAGMRHWLAHDYNSVDNKIVWDVLTVNLPKLIEQLESILADDENTEE
jgi:uncharacterized protein with HEPN domain